MFTVMDFAIWASQKLLLPTTVFSPGLSLCFRSAPGNFSKIPVLPAKVLPTTL